MAARDWSGAPDGGGLRKEAAAGTPKERKGIVRLCPGV